MIRAIILLSFLVAITAFMTPVRRTSSSLDMAFKFNFPAPKKPTPAPTKKPTPTPKKPSSSGFSFNFGGSKATPAKKSTSKATSSGGFAYGLVGSDIEAPEFDPLGLSVGKSEETILWYRAAELKHGRICMLASLGLFVQSFTHLPDKVFDANTGAGALSKVYSERPEAIWQIVLALAAIETFSLFKDGQGVGGDLGFDPLNLKSKNGYSENPEKFAGIQLRELKNGRLAMIGASGYLLQEYISGSNVLGL